MIQNEPERKNPFNPHTFNKAHLESSPDLPEFFKHSRHVFIMTNAGRPVYVRYGDETKTSIFLATMNAIMQKYLIFFSGDKTPQQLFKVIHHNLAIYFLQRKQMTLFCTTTNTNDSEFLIFSMLEFLNSQLISSVTDNVNVQLSSRPNYDPRALLSGTKNVLTLSIKNGINSPCVMLNATCPVPMNQAVRAQIHTIIKDQKHGSLLCTILMTETMIVDIVKKKEIDIKIDDILLVQNLIQGQSQLRKSENWIPICLPGLSAQGMIQAYIYFFYQNLAIFMISDDNSHDMFFALKDLSKEIIEKLQSTSMIQNIYQYLDNTPLVPRCMEQPSSIKHFIVRHQLGQIFLPQYMPFGKQSKEFKKYMHAYAEKYKEFLQHTQNLSQQPQKENYFSWSSDGFGLSQYHDTIILFCFDRLIDFQQVSTNVHSIQKMLKSDDLGNYFILKQF